MKERPILFSGPMVRALLAGTKTQTRRVMKPQPKQYIPGNEECWEWLGFTWNQRIHLPSDRLDIRGETDLPYMEGNRLWVKETFRPKVSDGQSTDDAVFAADYASPEKAQPWKPSIFMPRWASRITLEIESVRVERLHEISEEDAKAEGCDGNCPVGSIPAHQAGPCAYHYAQLWDSINAKRGFGWETNPFVWAITFRKL